MVDGWLAGCGARAGSTNPPASSTSWASSPTAGRPESRSRTHPTPRNNAGPGAIGRCRGPRVLSCRCNRLANRQRARRLTMPALRLGSSVGSARGRRGEQIAPLTQSGGASPSPGVDAGIHYLLVERASYRDGAPRSSPCQEPIRTRDWFPRRDPRHPASPGRTARTHPLLPSAAFTFERKPL